MASNFKLRLSGSVVPTEEVVLADTSTVSYNIHSTIDKILGSSITKDFGTASTEILYDTYLTTTTPVALSAATILNSDPDMGFLFMKIVSAGSSGTPDVLVSIDALGTQSIMLKGVGDFCMIPFADNINTITAASIKLSSSVSTTVANIEILVGKA